jgi:tripartite-type tricarboxylate transporter receptor subunit TctC
MRLCRFINPKKPFRYLLMAMVAALPSIGHAAGDVFPSKPIRLIVPTAGGTVDLIARYVAPPLSIAWKQPVVVDSRPGASGAIGAGIVAQAQPDGYTILASYNPLVNNAFLRKDVRDRFSDLQPITLAVASEQVLVVNPALPVANLAGFINLAKQKQGALNYASIAPGSASHLTMELFKARAGIDLEHIPYQGAGPAINALLGHNTDAGFFAVANVIQLVKAGQLKALAVTGSKRLKSLPEVPSMAELGFQNFDAAIWIGFSAPPHTPVDIVDKYQREIARILSSDETRKAIEQADFEVVASTPQQFKQFLEKETETWRAVAKQANVHLD